MSKLESCPFCGGEAEWRWHYGWWGIHCTECLAEIGDDGYTKEEIFELRILRIH